MRPGQSTAMASHSELYNTSTLPCHDPHHQAMAAAHFESAEAGSHSAEAANHIAHSAFGISANVRVRCDVGSVTWGLLIRIRSEAYPHGGVASSPLQPYEYAWFLLLLWSPYDTSCCYNQPFPPRPPTDTRSPLSIVIPTSPALCVWWACKIQ